MCTEHFPCARHLPLGNLYSCLARKGRFTHLLDEETEAQGRAVVHLALALAQEGRWTPGISVACLHDLRSCRL